MSLFFKERISDDAMERLLFRALCSLWQDESSAPRLDEGRLSAIVDRLLAAENKKLGRSHAADLKNAATVLALAVPEAYKLVQKGLLAAKTRNDQLYVEVVGEFRAWLRSHGCAFGPPPSMDDLTKMMKDWQK